MSRIPVSFEKSFTASTLSYIAFDISNEPEYQVDGNNQIIDGANICCHLLHIHNSNVTIRDLTFRHGNTEVVRVLKGEDIMFSKPKGSIYEIIDGGAVLITGKSDVTFENCMFINNTALMCGGAISNQSGGKVIFRNCKFEGNKAGHTGSAIDNLTRDSDLLVENCTFINNQSNTWHRFDSPHGQVTVFPETHAEISNSHFEGGSIPFDFKNGSDVKVNNNSYAEYCNWNESIAIRRVRSLSDYVYLILRLYWLPFKTLHKVYYRVNRDK